MTGTLTSSAATVTALAGVGAAPFPDVSLTPFVGQPVSGTGVAAGATVLSIQSASALTLSINATASGPQTLTFGTEPVTLAEAKAHCRIQFDDFDTLISDLIVTARQDIETRLRQALITQTWRLYLDGFGVSGGYYDRDTRRVWIDSGGTVGPGFGGVMIPGLNSIIHLPYGPLQSVISVKHFDTTGAIQTVDSSVYTVSKGIPGRIQPMFNKFWPITRIGIDSVYIDFVGGYGPTTATIPSVVKTAIKYIVNDLYQNPQPILAGRNTIIPDVVERLLATVDPGVYV